MRRRARSLLSALAAACAIGSGEARAAGTDAQRTSSLGWVRLPGAEECVGARDLAAAVEARLGRPVFVSPARAQVFIEGRVEPAPAGPGFRAHVALYDEKGALLGVRDLDQHEGSCRALDEQLALVVALLIDPDAALAPPGRPKPPEPPAPPRVVIERVLVPVGPPRTPMPAREPWRESLELGVAAAAGLLPGAGLGISLRGEITPPAFVPVQLGGFVWLDARAEDGARYSDVSLSYGLLGICPLSWARRGTYLSGCTSMELGAIRAVGHGFRLSEGQERLVVQAAIEGRVKQRIAGPLEAWLGLGLVVPLRRARFFYLDAAGNEQELYRMGAVAGVLDAGLGVAFP